MYELQVAPGSKMQLEFHFQYNMENIVLLSFSIKKQQIIFWLEVGISPFI